MNAQTYGFLLCALSLLTLLVYALDKKRAIKGEYRIPESLLLGLSVFCGAIGGYLAMFLVRHKIRKLYFHIVNLLAIFFQLFFLFFLIKNPNFFS